MATANERLQDEAIRRSIHMQRYSRATLRKIIAQLSRSTDRIAMEISKRDPGGDRFTDRRLRLLLDAVKEINDDAHKALAAILREDARGLAAAEVEATVNSLRNAAAVRLDIVTPATAQVWASVRARPFQGRLLKDYFRDLPAAAFKRLRGEISMGFLEGRTTDQIVRSIVGTKRNNYKDGVAEINRRSARTVVQTALNHTANAATEETYRANADLIKGVKWIATLDGKTSAVCRARDGMVFEQDKGPRPPAHLNCRSRTAPVLKSWKELGINLRQAPEGTRASMNGQVPASESYNSWLKKQPVDFQDDVLGPTRGKLYRDGGLSLDRFVDYSGREYSLDELRRRYSGAFEAAGV